MEVARPLGVRYTIAYDNYNFIDAIDRAIGMIEDMIDELLVAMFIASGEFRDVEPPTIRVDRNEEEHVLIFNLESTHPRQIELWNNKFDAEEENMKWLVEYAEDRLFMTDEYANIFMNENENEFIGTVSLEYIPPEELDGFIPPEESEEFITQNNIRQNENVLTFNAVRNIPNGSLNAITQNNIQNGNNLVNFKTTNDKTEYNFGRYYKHNTYKKLSNKHPYTKKPITDAVGYKAKLTRRKKPFSSAAKNWALRMQAKPWARTKKNARKKSTRRRK